jgi:hypothetical protein
MYTEINYYKEQNTAKLSNQIMNGYESDNSDNSDNYEWDTELNEELLPEINKDFRKSVLNTKHSLYENIVISGNEGTALAQDNTLLSKYLRNINDMYILSLKMVNNEENNYDLSIFPENARESIRMTLEWIKQFFSENTVPETIPYRDYIQKSFHEYPYVQTDVFE